MKIRRLRPSKSFSAICLSLAALIVTSCGSNREEPIKIGMVPDAGATQISVSQKQPLGDYLSKKLGRPVKLIIPTSYNATVEAIGNGSLDIAYLGGLTYAKAHELYGVVPLVQRDIDQHFHSLFITTAGSGIRQLVDLRGKTFCFGDINSTSGHLIPQSMLLKAGIDPQRDFSSVRYTGSHPATALAVATGSCDAGALDETVFDQMIEAGKIDKKTVTVFKVSKPFADYVWVARKGLGPSTRNAFASALLDLREGKGDNVLSILRGKRFVPASNASYVDVTKTAKRIGLM